MWSVAVCLDNHDTAFEQGDECNGSRRMGRCNLGY